MPQLFDLALVKTLEKDKHFLETTALPIVTVSATFREDLKRLHGLPDNNRDQDTVFSRAHYSMALAVAVSAWGTRLNPQKAWIVDPTNYVSYKDWLSVALTEEIAKGLARHPFLKVLKDFVDKFGRKKLPILGSITPPLLYLTQQVERPILSFHIAAGNTIALQGKKVFQMITDPHVREEYVTHAENPRVHFGVFDEATKLEFLEKAALAGKEASPERIIVTGPPVDERIIAARAHKYPWRSGPLRLCITTGGLGTNKGEIKQILTQLLPQLRRRPSPFQLIVYAATHSDIAELVRTLAAEARVAIEPAAATTAKLRLLYHPQIVDANELLIKHAFPWAHGFITKPSGDMAYDAVGSGSFLLTLAEWGEWEQNIRRIFEQKGISRRAATTNIGAQLEVLMNAQYKAQSWIEQAMLRTASIEPLYLRGVQSIIEAYRTVI